MRIRVKEINPESGRKVQVYSAWDINQIANCMLLTAKENGAGQKTDTPPDIWFKDKDDEYLTLHCIPTNKKLWKVDKFEKFIEERKKLIRRKFIELGLLFSDDDDD